MRWTTRSVGLATALAAVSCLGGPDPWGDAEPEYSGMAESDIPLTIFLSEAQTTVRRIATTPDETMGVLHLDGKSLDDRTVLIFSGQLHRFDGPVEDHLMVIQPRYYSKAAGAANPDGFLVVDLKANDRIRVVERDGWPLGTMAGVFRGDIIATNQLALNGPLPSDLTSLYIRPAGYGQRPPNVLSDVALQIQPNVWLSALRPIGRGDDPCQGENVVDTTLAGTGLEVQARVEGFPAGRPVTVEVHYRVPHYTAEHPVEHLWDYFSDMWAGEVDETVQTAVILGSAEGGAIPLPGYVTLDPPWGSDLYAMSIEVRAYQDPHSGATGGLIHELMVVDEGSQVVVDHFELCPIGDEPCRALRDANTAYNVVARRNVIEWTAQRQGLYDTITRPIGRCSGGTSVGGTFADDCTVYRENSDTELSYRVSSELNFELNVDGQAKGSASWGRVLPGIGGADLGGQLKATFNLQADLTASFSTSRTWISRHSLDVIYDPSETQLQWWRVVTPRVRYVQVGEFDACGARRNAHDVYLSDLTESRLVLACEAVPSYDAVCHAVEPTAETVGACNQRLIDPDSERGRQCIAGTP